MSNSASKAQYQSRPFSPSPARETRHTASHPPSVLLGAPLAGTTASSSTVNLAGLPAPSGSAVTGIEGLPVKRSGKLAGLFKRKNKHSASSSSSPEQRRGEESVSGFGGGRPISGHSSQRSESDSTASSSSPPLGATSLLAALASTGPQTPQSVRLAADRSNEQSPGDASPGMRPRFGWDAYRASQTPSAGQASPRSAGSRSSSSSSASSGIATSKSFPRIHQPTVVRNHGGGLSFLPPPAEVSPTGSTFSLHQPVSVRSSRASLPPASKSRASILNFGTDRPSANLENLSRERSKSLRDPNKGDERRKSGSAIYGLSRSPDRQLSRASIQRHVASVSSFSTSQEDLVPPPFRYGNPSIDNILSQTDDSLPLESRGEEDWMGFPITAEGRLRNIAVFAGMSPLLSPSFLGPAIPDPISTQERLSNSNSADLENMLGQGVSSVASSKPVAEEHKGVLHEGGTKVPDPGEAMLRVSEEAVVMEEHGGVLEEPMVTDNRGQEPAQSALVSDGVMDPDDTQYAGEANAGNVDEKPASSGDRSFLETPETTDDPDLLPGSGDAIKQRGNLELAADKHFETVVTEIEESDHEEPSIDGPTQNHEFPSTAGNIDYEVKADTSDEEHTAHDAVAIGEAEQHHPLLADGNLQSAQSEAVDPIGVAAAAIPAEEATPYEVQRSSDDAVRAPLSERGQPVQQVEDIEEADRDHPLLVDINRLSSRDHAAVAVEEAEPEAEHFLDETADEVKGTSVPASDAGPMAMGHSAQETQDIEAADHDHSSLLDNIRNDPESQVIAGETDELENNPPSLDLRYTPHRQEMDVLAQALIPNNYDDTTVTKTPPGTQQDDEDDLVLNEVHETSARASRPATPPPHLSANEGQLDSPVDPSYVPPYKARTTSRSRTQASQARDSVPAIPTIESNENFAVTLHASLNHASTALPYVPGRRLSNCT